jgi:uncharacterized protein (UPF0332 family)
MAGRMSSEFVQLLEQRKLFRSRIAREMIKKEIKAAERDLQDARDSLEQKKFKWATIQGYYSIFHSARALLYSRGFREKSHYALLVAIRELYSNELEQELIRSFGQAMELREQADYGLEFSESGAMETIESAEKFLQRAKELLMIVKS